MILTMGFVNQLITGPHIPGMGKHVANISGPKGEISGIMSAIGPTLCRDEETCGAQKGKYMELCQPYGFEIYVYSV